MPDNIYYPQEIPDSPFPVGQTINNNDSPASPSGILSPKPIMNNPFPNRMISHETIASSLNTRSKKILAQYSFTKNGAMQIGEFEQGVSGDVRISPDGIIARDLSGNVTFALDGDTGDATFKGTILAGSLISEGIIDGGSININDIFIVDPDGSLTINNLDPTIIVKIAASDLALQVLNLDIGAPGDSTGQLRLFSNHILYAYINSDEGLNLLNSIPFTLNGTATPNAPATHSGALYIDQSGGKNRLMCRFPTGASQQIAIEP